MNAKRFSTIAAAMKIFAFLLLHRFVNSTLAGSLTVDEENGFTLPWEYMLLTIRDNENAIVDIRRRRTEPSQQKLMSAPLKTVQQEGGRSIEFVPRDNNTGVWFASSAAVVSAEFRDNVSKNNFPSQQPPPPQQYFVPGPSMASLMWPDIYFGTISQLRAVGMYRELSMFICTSHQIFSTSAMYGSQYYPNSQSPIYAY